MYACMDQVSFFENAGGEVVSGNRPVFLVDIFVLHILCEDAILALCKHIKALNPS